MKYFFLLVILLTAISTAFKRHRPPQYPRLTPFMVFGSSLVFLVGCQPVSIFATTIGCIFVWFCLCWLVGRLWEKRGRSFGSGFVVSFFLSPLVGLIIAAGLETDKETIENRAIFAKTAARCPHCQGLNNPNASACQHCDRPISFYKVCPKCGDAIKREALTCRFCEHSFNKTEVAQDLRQALLHDSVVVQRRAAQAFMNWKDPDYFEEEKVLSKLVSADCEAWEEAIENTSNLPPEQSLPLLINIARDAEMKFSRVLSIKIIDRAMVRIAQLGTEVYQSALVYEVCLPCQRSNVLFQNQAARLLVLSPTPEVAEALTSILIDRAKSAVLFDEIEENLLICGSYALEAVALERQKKLSSTTPMVRKALHRIYLRLKSAVVIDSNGNRIVDPAMLIANRKRMRRRRQLLVTVIAGSILSALGGVFIWIEVELQKGKFRQREEIQKKQASEMARHLEQEIEIIKYAGLLVQKHGSARRLSSLPDAQTYCAARSQMRVPTFAEMYDICRAGDSRVGLINVFSGTGPTEASRVGQYPVWTDSGIIKLDSKSYCTYGRPNVAGAYAVCVKNDDARPKTLRVGRLTIDLSRPEYYGTLQAARTSCRERRFRKRSMRLPKLKELISICESLQKQGLSSGGTYWANDPNHEQRTASIVDFTASCLVSAQDYNRMRGYALCIR